MNWMQLAVELTRQVLGSESTREPEPQQPADLGTALAQQFTLIDRKVDAAVRMVNAHEKELERAVRRQRVWNYALAAGILIAVVIALLR